MSIKNLKAKIINAYNEQMNIEYKKPSTSEADEVAKTLYNYVIEFNDIFINEKIIKTCKADIKRLQEIDHKKAWSELIEAVEAVVKYAEDKLKNK